MDGGSVIHGCDVGVSMNGQHFVHGSNKKILLDIEPSRWIFATPGPAMMMHGYISDWALQEWIHDRGGALPDPQFSPFANLQFAAG